MFSFCLCKSYISDLVHAHDLEDVVVVNTPEAGVDRMTADLEVVAEVVQEVDQGHTDHQDHQDLTLDHRRMMFRTT